MPRKNQSGFFLIEVVVASAIITVVLVLLVGSIQDSVEVSQRALERTQAALLLEEGSEAVKSIRSAGWSNIQNATAGTTYYLHFTSAWSLTTTPETVDSRFTRTVTFADVVRDGNDDIAASGDADSGTRKVTVSVTWPTPAGDKTELLSFYIADI